MLPLFGAWSQIMNNKYLISNYKYFICINSRCIGPFIPPYIKEHWWNLLTSKLTDKNALVGCTINPYDTTYGHSSNWCPHIQSYLLCFDHRAYNLAMNNNIFSLNIDSKKTDIIQNREIGFSKVILAAGYNIVCNMKIFEDYNFNIKSSFPEIKTDPCDPLSTYILDPYELMFFKILRGSNADSYNDHTNKLANIFLNGHKQELITKLWYMLCI